MIISLMVLNNCEAQNFRWIRLPFSRGKFQLMPANLTVPNKYDVQISKKSAYYGLKNNPSEENLLLKCNIYNTFYTTCYSWHYAMYYMLHAAHSQCLVKTLILLFYFYINQETIHSAHYF